MHTDNTNLSATEGSVPTLHSIFSRENQLGVCHSGSDKCPLIGMDRVREPHYEKVTCTDHPSSPKQRLTLWVRRTIPNYICFAVIMSKGCRRNHLKMKADIHEGKHSCTNSRMNLASSTSFSVQNLMIWFWMITSHVYVTSHSTTSTLSGKINSHGLRLQSKSKTVIQQHGKQHQQTIQVSFGGIFAAAISPP